MSFLRPVFNVLSSTRVRALLSLGMVLGLGAVGTLAAWSSTVVATSGQFTTGTVDITINNSNDPVTYASAPLTGLFPGSITSGAFTVRNVGSTYFSYSVAVTGTGLGAFFDVTVRKDGSVTAPCTDGTAVTPSLAPLPANLQIAPVAAPLAATSGVQVLCVSLRLSPDAPASAQSSTGNVSLLFTATGA